MNDKVGFWIYIIYIYVLIAIKLFFLVTLIIIKLNKNASDKIVTLNAISKNMFVGMLAILMVYLFHPRNNVEQVIVHGETKLLLFLFGVISLLELPWNYVYDKFIGKTNIGLSSNQFSLILGSIITAIVTGLIFLIKKIEINISIHNEYNCYEY